MLTAIETPTPTADESAAILTRNLRVREPFLYLRYGDGAIECIEGIGTGTRDGEIYTNGLARELQRLWQLVIRAENVFIGDWMSASFDARSEARRYRAAYERLLDGARANFLHFEALLLMRESVELLDFYRAVKEDPRRKVFMGPAACYGAALMMGAEFIETPLSDLLRYTGRLSDQLISSEFDILLWGAGLAGNIPALRCWEKHRERTYIHLGSAMDPLFRGMTRQQQLTQLAARAFFAELL